MMRLLVTLITLLVAVHAAVDPERQKCWEILNPSSTFWYFNDYYATTFGIVHNVSKIQSFEVRKTNLFKEIQSLGWSRNVIHSTVYPFLVAVFQPYLREVVEGELERKWNDETYDYDVPEMKEDMTGTLEEMVRFMAKTFEEEATKLEAIEEQSRISENINRISNEKLENNGTDVKYLKESVDKYLAKILDPEYPGAYHYHMVSYRDWTSKMEDRLRDYLKNKVFFQKLQDNPLNGGHDILTFLVINPKVIKSPKVNPLLRMSITKDIMDFKNLDEHFFKFLGCFITEFGEGPLVRFMGLDTWHLLAKLQQLEIGYESNTSKGIVHWVDLADAIFQECKALDIDDLFYRVYLVALKIRSFIQNLDIEKKISPQYQNIQLLIKEAYLRLQQNPKFIIAVLKTLQKDDFWDRQSDVQSSYRRIISKFKSYIIPYCHTNTPLLDCISGGLSSADAWRQFPHAVRALKLETADIYIAEDGQKMFAATKFFRDYRKANGESLFQLKVDFLDPKSSVVELVNLTESIGRTVYDFLWFEAVKILYDRRDTEEFKLDWAPFFELQTQMSQNLRTIKEEIVRAAGE